MTGLQSIELALRPVPRKLLGPGQQSPKRETDHRCFELAEIAEVLDMPGGAVDGLIRAGLLPVVELGQRRLVAAEAVLAFTPEQRRAEVLEALDAVERRRGRR